MDKKDLLILMTGHINTLVPALLTERGRHSHQIYRAPINHRNIDYFVLNNRHATGRAVKHSFVRPEPSEAFDTMPMVLFPHVITEDGGEVVSHSRMLGQKEMKLPPALNSIGSKQGILKGMKIDLVRNTDFKRLLLVFGFEWKTSNGDDVTADPSVKDIMKFFHQFRKVNVKTVMGVKKFLEEFTLDHMFSYDDSRDILTNLNRLGWLLRSLTNFRFSPGDGQHRWWCFSSLIQGYPEAYNFLPLPFKRYGDFPEDLQNYESWQIHTVKQVNFLGLLGGSFTPQSVAQCVSYSEEKTKAQDLMVKWRFYTFVGLLCNRIAAEEWDRHNCEPCNFDNYWNADIHSKNAQLTTNHLKMWDILSDMIDNDVSLQSESRLLSKDSKWSDSKSKITSSLKSGKFRDSQPAGFSKQLLNLLYILKAFCDDKKSFLIFPDMADKNHWEKQRSNDIGQWLHHFQTFEFLKFVYDANAQAQHYIQLRVWCEQKLIHLLRPENNEELQNKVTNGEEIPWKDIPKSKYPIMCWFIPEYDRRMKRVNIGGDKLPTSGLVDKVTESLWCLCFRNIFECITLHGYDFEVFNDDEMEHFQVPEDTVVDASGFFEDTTNHNFCLKYYLSVDGETIPEFYFIDIDTTRVGANLHVNKNGKKASNPAKRSWSIRSRFTLPILLELYPYYVKIRHEPFSRKLDFFTNHYGKWNGQKVVNGAVFNDKVHGLKRQHFEADNLPAFDEFKCPGLLFEDFIEDLRNGSFNCDMIEPFRDHVNKHFLQADINELFEDQVKALLKSQTPSSVAQASNSGAATLNDSVSGQQQEQGTEGQDSASNVVAMAPPPSATKNKNCHTTFTRAIDNLKPSAMEVCTALSRLALNYNEIGVDQMFSISFKKDFLKQIDMNDKTQKIVWNQAVNDLGAKIPQQGAGLGQKHSVKAITFNNSCIEIGSSVENSDRVLRSTIQNDIEMENVTLDDAVEIARVDEVVPVCSNKECNIKSVDPNDDSPPTLKCAKCNVNWFHEECGGSLLMTGKSFRVCEECGVLGGQLTDSDEDSNEDSDSDKDSAGDDDDKTEEDEVLSMKNPDEEGNSDEVSEDVERKSPTIKVVSKKTSAETVTEKVKSPLPKTPPRKKTFLFGHCVNPDCKMSASPMNVDANLCEKCKKYHSHPECLFTFKGSSVCHVCAHPDMYETATPLKEDKSGSTRKDEKETKKRGHKESEEDPAKKKRRKNDRPSTEKKTGKKDDKKSSPTKKTTKKTTIGKKAAPGKTTTPGKKTTSGKKGTPGNKPHGSAKHHRKGGKK